jgi:uncharacterized iron-regulated membrane protein
MRSWVFIHKWSSLVCALFLLLLCLTGLPLIFAEEIEHLTDDVEPRPMPEGTPWVSMDRMVESALALHPSKVVRYMYWDEAEHPGLMGITLTSSVDAPPDDFLPLTLDARTAEVLKQHEVGGFMDIMLRLHTDMYAGLPGMLFLGFMGLLLAVATISGIVIYKPFMHRLDFGTVRRQKSANIKWLDLHNLLGIVTVVWVLVVGLTGTINTLSMIMLGIWKNDQLAEMIEPYKNAPPLESFGSVQAAFETTTKAVEHMDVSFIAFPGSPFSSPHHYVFFMKGNTPVTSHLLQPVLIDAQTSTLTDTRELPWYMKVLLLSQPLHFGNYGEFPLKILWALLDIISIIVLVSGLYLWLKKYSRRQEVQDLLMQVDGAPVR